MQDIVSMIDPSLEFVESYDRSTFVVCKVEKEGQFYILKVDNNRTHNTSQVKHERIVLTKAKDVLGITHLVQDYGVMGDYEAILKEFAPGEIFNGFQENAIELMRSLESTVGSLHLLRIAGLEAIPQNIVVSSDNSSITIVDLGSAEIFPWYKYFRFRDELEMDIFRLKYIRRSFR